MTPESDCFEVASGEEFDAFLGPLGELLQSSYGEALRSVILIGSRVVGGYRDNSDFDLCLLWKADSELPLPTEQAALLVREYWRRAKRFCIDVVWNGSEQSLYEHESYAVGEEARCPALVRKAVRCHSRLLWGEDTRSRVVLGGRDEVLADLIKTALSWIRCVHNPENRHDMKHDIPYPAAAPCREDKYLAACG